MAFDLQNERHFMIGLLPVADGSLSRLDCKHMLGIFPSLTYRYMECSCVVVLTTLCSAFAIRRMECSIDVEVTAHIYLAINGNQGMVAGY